MSRVIPREELAAYQRWQIGNFDAPGATGAAPSAAPAAQPPAPSDSVQASEDARPESKPAQSTAEDLSQAYEAARAEGYRSGLEEGRTAGSAELAQTTRERLDFLSAIVGNLQVSLAHLDQHVADQLLDLSLEVARQIVLGILQVDREILLPVIRQAISELPLHHGAVSLFLHPADASTLTEILREQLTHTTLHIVPDADVSPGGCLVKAGNSEIDASIETRWRRVLEAMGAKATEWLPKPLAE